MKTCNDCIYFHQAGNKPDRIKGRCHLYPKSMETIAGHWCGQLKEKVHVISDFPKDQSCTHQNTGVDFINDSVKCLQCGEDITQNWRESL